MGGTINRVPTPPGKSWILFLENSRTWKVLEKITLVLESPGKISLKVVHFLVVQMENKQQ